MKYHRYKQVLINILNTCNAQCYLIISAFLLMSDSNCSTVHLSIMNSGSFIEVCAGPAIVNPLHGKVMCEGLRRVVNTTNNVLA